MAILKRTRRTAYKVGRVANDINAVATGRIGPRIVNKAAGRAFGSAMRSSGCLLPVAAIVVPALVAGFYAVVAMLAFGPVRTVMANLIGVLS